MPPFWGSRPSVCFAHRCLTHPSMCSGQPGPPENSPARVSSEGTAASLSQRGGGGQAEPLPGEGVGPRAPPWGPPAPPAAPGARVICVDSWSPSPYTSLTPRHVVPSLVIPEPSTVAPHLFTRSPRRPQGLGCLSQVSLQPPKPQPRGQRSPGPTHPEGRDGRLMGEAGSGPGASPAHRLRGGEAGRPARGPGLCLRKGSAAARLALLVLASVLGGESAPLTRSPVCQRPCGSRVPRGADGRAVRGPGPPAELLCGDCSRGRGSRLWCHPRVTVSTCRACAGACWEFPSCPFWGPLLSPREWVGAHHTQGGCHFHPRHASWFTVPSLCRTTPWAHGETEQHLLLPARRGPWSRESSHQRLWEERMSEEGRERRAHGHSHVGRAHIHCTSGCSCSRGTAAPPWVCVTAAPLHPA